jgi:UDP-N-acetylglucosamine--N-acetylmuramyl-(pentapeptide) pyrophosphoryl-undecaprenol N-acetylglucosamine transferase
MSTILIAAGGTGGHIFPGLAVAEPLIANGNQVVWVGTINGLESTLVPKHNIKIYYIKISGIRGKKIFTKLFGVVNILFAIFQSIKIIKSLNPTTVLGFGGFVSGPVGVAAKLLRRKLIIHEQNTIAGTANKILSLFADQVLESFPNSFNNKNNKKLVLTGLPIRANLLAKNFDSNFNKFNNILKILVLGGSRGAQFLNQTVPKSLFDIKNIKIIHQTGEQEFAQTTETYAKYFINANNYETKPFINDMQEAYLTADLIICRAGASTIFEIMKVGIASILVPLPWAIDDHQTKNALYLVNNNAAILLKQEEASSEKLKALIIDLINNPDKLRNMQLAAKLLYQPYESCSSVDLIVKYV